MSVTQLYLIRHAEVEERYHRTFAGSRIDMGLSELGHRQSARLATWLQPRKFDHVYLSPMQRVQLTSAPWRPHYTGPIMTLPDLREVDFGAWTGLGWDGVQEKFGVSAYDWLQQFEKGFPEGEAEAGFRARLNGCLERILSENRGGTVAVFCHGGVVRGLLSLLLKLPMTHWENFEVDYASCTWITVGTPKAGRLRNEVQLHNFTPWRDL